MPAPRPKLAIVITEDKIGHIHAEHQVGYYREQVG